MRICQTFSIAFILLISIRVAAAEVSNPLSIETLEISNATNENLLAKLENFKNLKKLKINCLESLEKIPASIGELSKLEEFDMDNGNGCSMNAQLPDSIGKLHELRVLNLSGAQDNRLGNKLGSRRQLPESLNQLKKLDTLDLSRNGLREIPVIIRKIQALRTLRLDNNDLRDLPNWLNDMSNLKNISLGGNWKISCSPDKQEKLQKRFRKISLSFANEYDCPEKK